MKIPLKWTSSVFDHSGYGTAARNYIGALLDSNKVDLTVKAVSFEKQHTNHGELQQKIKPYINKNVPYKIQVVHLTPENYPPLIESNKYNIAYTTWETDRLPDPWVPLCNKMDELWVPSKWNKEIFESSGINKPVYVVPHGVNIDGKVSYISMGVEDNIFIFYSIFQWCYDKETRVLTKEGFKYFKDLSYDDELATFDRTTEELVYQKPKKIVSFDRNGKMLKVENNSFNFCITPDHRMLVRHKENRKWKLIPANDLISHRTNKFQEKWRFKKNCKWTGREQSLFEFPSRIKYHKNTIVKNSIPMDSFLSFLGWYISEGSTHFSNGHYIDITQTKNEEYIHEIQHTITLCGYSPFRVQGGIRFASRQMFDYLKQFGLCNEKFVPAWLKELSSRQIRLFLDSFFKGDGTLKNGEFIKCTTTSLLLAEDILECLIKIGYSGSINIEPPRESVIVENSKERTIYGKLDKYIISVNKHMNEPALSYIDKPELIDYNDKIYCVSVPNETLLVERHGKIIWSGNTERKAPLVLLKSYLTEFLPREKVCLALKTYRINTTSREQSVIKQDIANMKKSLQLTDFPQVRFFGSLLSAEHMRGFHDRGDCFVLTSRAEGFSLCHAEAMAHGKPTIGTKYSGNLDFMNGKNSYLVNCQETPVNNMLFPNYNGHMTWAEPDIMHLRKLMRYIFENREEAKEKGVIAKKYMQENFSWEKAADCIIDRLTEIQKGL